MSLPDFTKFEEKIGFSFSNRDLLVQALTHRSYLNEAGNVGENAVGKSHNERLEFLGDAVLELIITDYLYHKFPSKTEGDLTAYRAALVNAEMLSSVADIMSVGDYLLLSRGEARDTGRARQSILANTFEAIIGALFLDQGYNAARDFIAKFLFPKTEEVVAKQLWQDAKSFFQEQAQEIAGATPVYRVLAEEGPDHDKVFTVGLYIGNELVTKGTGPSKQRAEQEAAKLGLEAKGWVK